MQYQSTVVLFIFQLTRHAALTKFKYTWRFISLFSWIAKLFCFESKGAPLPFNVAASMSATNTCYAVRYLMSNEHQRTAGASQGGSTKIVGEGILIYRNTN